jgi:hypothetical protein
MDTSATFNFPLIEKVLIPASYENLADKKKLFIQLKSLLLEDFFYLSNLAFNQVHK